MMDFTPRPSAAFAANFEAIIDTAIEKANAVERASYLAKSPDALRPAIGAGRMGNECLRAIAYEFYRTPKDEGRGISGRLQRIFDRGHVMEAKMAGYLRAAGFTLLTENDRGRQFRYDVCKYEDGKGRIKGMIDGVITAAPYETGIVGPALWENKELGSKGWSKLAKLGLRAYGGDYFPQVQLGMAYMGLTDNPALFTAKNADTQEIYAEKVPFDQAAAQAASDKAAKVVSAADPEELPRVAREPTDSRCKWCDYAARCWAAPAVPAVPAAASAPWAWGAAK